MGISHSNLDRGILILLRRAESGEWMWNALPSLLLLVMVVAVDSVVIVDVGDGVAVVLCEGFASVVVVVMMVVVVVVPVDDEMQKGVLDC
jgi:membrane protein YdbS with pleckstrin-like domain